jgi:inosine-uridine nucleoside N-ribohydrolase
MDEGRRFFQETDQDPADAILNILRERPARSVTYIALGPLTNLAQIMRQDPHTVRARIGSVVCMGGMCNCTIRSCLRH